VLQHLADKGYIVRSAFPNLVLPSIDGSLFQNISQLYAKDMTVKLRWYEEDYCDENEKPFSKELLQVNVKLDKQE
jgi:hypothetical protein